MSRLCVRSSASLFHDVERDVPSNLDTPTAVTHNYGMKRLMQSGVTALVALAVVTQTALACGDPPGHAVAGPKAQLMIQGRDRVCARATLPLSGASRYLKADSKTYAVLLLRRLRDVLLRPNCLFRADLRRVGGLL